VTTPITKKDHDVCPKCGWYAHGKYASPTECDPAAGDAASTLQAAVSEVPSTKLGYGRGVIAFEVDDKLHVRLNVNRHDRAFHLDDVWLLADLSHDDAVDLVRTITAWRGRQINRELRSLDRKMREATKLVIDAARAAGYTVKQPEFKELPPESNRWDVGPGELQRLEVTVAAARKFLADRGEHDLPSHQAMTRQFAEAIVKLSNREPSWIVIDRPNEYDPPTEAELERARWSTQKTSATREAAQPGYVCTCNRYTQPGEHTAACVHRNADRVNGVSDGWLAKIEALKPGDACEFYLSNTWLHGKVSKNGGSGYWEIIDETEARRGAATYVFIEHIRLPGQTEAWPR
jgi:hypothetical protein